MTSFTTPATGVASGGTNYGSTGYRNYVLITLTLVYALNFIDRYLLNVIAQPIITEFGLSDTEFGFLNGPPFAIFYAIMGIPIAMLADRYNRTLVLAFSIATWSVMAALCGFATSFLFLLIARIGVAVGEAGGTPSSTSILGDYFKPASRAAALSVYATGVTLGAALANYLGGPIVRNLNGAALQEWFEDWGWTWMLGLTDWSEIAGWRVAFVVVGAPGVLVALILLLTVREPPRGFSDPPSTVKPQRANMLETLKELGSKPTFWIMTMGASLTALVGYGIASFAAPMVQRVHGIDPGTFAVQFGGPLALMGALGTVSAGMLIDRLSPRMPRAVAVVPAVGLLLAVPLFIVAFYRPTEQLYTVARPLWCLGTFFHYMYIGSQYTIGQGVVRQHARASAIAILLLAVALIGNGLGPLIVGWLSDMFMSVQLKQAHLGGLLTTDLCRNAIELIKLPADQQAICRAAYGEGLRSSMVATALIFIPAALFFLLASMTLHKDMVAHTAR